MSGHIPHLILALTGIVQSIWAFVVLCCQHKNFAIGFWSILLGSLAAVSFHLNWVKRRETLERWYTKKTLRYLHTIGFLSAVAGFVSLIWYIFVQFYYNMPITPYEESVLITAICALYCGFWGVLLLCYSQEYEQIITEAPILTENNA
ncbi:hypothetical protein WH47_10976 [Habropoda laboriosa]|uniref:Uncharacterized protein n=1 Tax=Habropoda laboriosa TaxID=597456 RepID=A0A0L7R9L7_9HYME|nr:hypothetical protein WH47_10976 [Habropoda laboriosa]